MTISIKLPRSKQDMEGTGDRPIVGNGTQIFNDKGDEITGIREIDISIRLGAIVTATVEVMVSCDSDMDNIHALLGTKTLADVLKLHGVTDYAIGQQAADLEWARSSNCSYVVRNAPEQPETKDPSEYD